MPNLYKMHNVTDEYYESYSSVAETFISAVEQASDAAIRYGEAVYIESFDVDHISQATVISVLRTHDGSGKYVATVSPRKTED